MSELNLSNKFIGNSALIIDLSEDYTWSKLIILVPYRLTARFTQILQRKLPCESVLVYIYSIDDGSRDYTQSTRLWHGPWPTSIPLQQCLHTSLVRVVMTVGSHQEHSVLVCQQESVQPCLCTM